LEHFLPIFYVCSYFYMMSCVLRKFKKYCLSI
jgi:hypothetical protein